MRLDVHLILAMVRHPTPECKHHHPLPRHRGLLNSPTTRGNILKCTMVVRNATGSTYLTTIHAISQPVMDMSNARW
jgi:hypothetical protein